ncbi:hypothetical protein L249_4480, partial [Ophiocordyceps polyrhachis-furcata BCC 54312]
IQGTWPEGLGGLRNAGLAAAGPRPPYVIEAIRYSGYTRRLRRTAATAVQAVRAVRRKEYRIRLRLRQTPSLLQFPYCFFFPSRTLSSARFFRLLFSSSSLPSFSSLPLLPTAGPTAYRDNRNRVRIRIRIRNEIDSYRIRFSRSARHSYTYTQGTRLEGLGGLRNAGPAVAGPRPPYVIEAEAATLYSGYGRTGRTGQQDKQGVPFLAIQLASV